MKKSTFILLAACFFVLAFCTQCKKGGPTAFQFFTRIDTAQTKLNLYIDGQYVAPLPYIQLSTPDDNLIPTGDTSKLNAAIYKMVETGKRTFSAKDANGVTKSEIELKISGDGYSGKYKAGKNQTYFVSGTTDNAIPMDLFY